ncbi:MAG: hypothetical protein IM584_08930 [Chitinophagaceae bacterium]|nr:hypothetical protein [Chitinophagaceae bacterium]MCA6451604.1 hypothetical protein [Chitinophagaceae bacterium]MCA6456242.1 hypothetical protein [Chitinophagaceae bacterium]MCA6460269.1 hypothetical protein [Chitinophagaceae bacterium]MCA6465156.1 hypothetical protein [Chitinophagaceae bacterium]
MKRNFTLTAILCAVLFVNIAKATDHKDSVQQQLKAKLELMEKHIQQLQAEVRILRESDRTQQAELTAIKEAAPAARTKKLVIDRRGSKQASFQ